MEVPYVQVAYLGAKKRVYTTDAPLGHYPCSARSDWDRKGLDELFGRVGDAGV